MSVIDKLLKWGLIATVNVEDKPDGHLRVTVIGIPVYDSARQERRLARRRKRKQLDRQVEGQCAADESKAPDKR